MGQMRRKPAGKCAWGKGALFLSTRKGQLGRARRQCFACTVPFYLSLRGSQWPPHRLSLG